VTTPQQVKGYLASMGRTFSSFFEAMLGMMVDSSDDVCEVLADRINAQAFAERKAKLAPARRRRYMKRRRK